MASGFEAVYEAYGRRVHDYLVRLTNDPGAAEEICQETFLRYLRRPPRLEEGNGSLGGWLFKVATNLARDRARRKPALSLEYEPLSCGGDGASESASRDLQARIRREVEALPQELRAAFLLRAHHELTFPRIADALEVSERTAKERFRRAREILAHRLAHLIREE